MLKMEKEYIEEFGDIPKDPIERIDYLLEHMHLKQCRLNFNQEVHRLRNMKWNHLSYTIYLLPKATPRPRSGANGVFYVKGAADNKKFFQRYLINKDIPLITTPTKFRCRSYFPIPKSMNSVEKLLAELGFIYPVSKPDFDNLAKAYCDMTQGILLYDDSLVVKGVSEKYYSVKPRIEIELSWMDDYDSAYNKKKIKMKGE